MLCKRGSLTNVVNVGRWRVCIGLCAGRLETVSNARGCLIMVLIHESRSSSIGAFLVTRLIVPPALPSLCWVPRRSRADELRAATSTWTGQLRLKGAVGHSATGRGTACNRKRRMIERNGITEAELRKCGVGCCRHFFGLTPT